MDNEIVYKATKADGDIFEYTVEYFSITERQLTIKLKPPTVLRLRDQEMEGTYFVFGWQKQKFKVSTFGVNKIKWNSKETIVTFYASNIIGLNTPPPSARLFFVIPNIIDTADYKEGTVVNLSKEQSRRAYDYSSFLFKNKVWTIRNAYRRDDFYEVGIPMDLLSGAESHTTSNECILETQYDKNDNWQQLQDDASSIGLLMSLCYGKTLLWQTSWSYTQNSHQFLSSSGKKFIYEFKSSISKLNSVPALDPSFGIGHVNAHKVDVTDFIEKISFDYLQEKEFWDRILYWYLRFFEVQSQSLMYTMIFGMLYDVLTEKFFSKRKKCEQIGHGITLLKKDKTKKKMLNEQLTSLLSEIEPAWDASRSDVLINKVIEWNSAPSYIKKIDIMFKEGGGKLSEKHIEIIKRRHEIMHTGNLGMSTNTEYNQHLVSCLEIFFLLALPMMGYSGNVRIFDRVFYIDDYLPEYEKLKLASAK